MKTCPFCGSSRVQIECCGSCHCVKCLNCEATGPCTKDDGVGSSEEAEWLWDNAIRRGRVVI